MICQPTAEWNVNPFHRKYWHGRYVSLDGTVAGEIDESDLEAVLFAGQTDPDDWDGDVAAVMLLADGRYVSFETFWGPTGNGFMEDAYGGDADLCFASDLNTAVMMGLTDEGRRLCGIPVEGLLTSQPEGGRMGGC